MCPLFLRDFFLKKIPGSSEKSRSHVLFFFAEWPSSSNLAKFKRVVLHPYGKYLLDKKPYHLAYVLFFLASPSYSICVKDIVGNSSLNRGKKRRGRAPFYTGKERGSSLFPLSPSEEKKVLYAWKNEKPVKWRRGKDKKRGLYPSLHCWNRGL